MTDDEINARFKKQAVLFTDSARGGWSQAYQVYDNGKLTKMSIIAYTKNRKIKSTTSFYYAETDTEFTNIRSMLEAYLKDHPE